MTNVATSRSLPLLTALLLVVLTGCAGGNSDALTEESFANLLKVEDIQAATGGMGLETRLRDIKQMGALVDAAQVADMDAGYLRSFDSVEGPSRSISFSVIDFNSRTSARNHFDKLRIETPGLEEMSQPIGDSSAKALFNDKGLGSILAMSKEDKFVSLHTTIASGESPLVDTAGLERLAAIVEKRLK